jgi:predicted phosphodiesterase
VRINYFSDIHLEFGLLEAPDNNADIIVAAGDIGVGTQGLDWLKSLKKQVVYVAGNHEFYSSDYQKTLKSIRMQCKNSNVRFLENESFIFQGVRFLGCTLWADLYAEGDKNADALGKRLNDFRKITFAEEPFDAMKFSHLHQVSRTWLEQELAQPFSGKTVVITHHAPSYWSWKDSAKALKKLAYCNDLKPLLHEYEIAAWIHGHVHCLADYRIAGAKVLCNPRGYYDRKMVSAFDLNRIVDI